MLGSQLEPGLKNPDGILLHLLTNHAPVWLAGILGAGIISAVMGSDTHQVLAVSTMFTKDVFAHYGGKTKYGERGSVYFARGFIVVVTLIAYIVALITPASIFELAVRFAFSGFAAMAPVMIAALFWKRSTKYGALASTLWVAAWLLLTWYLQNISDGMAPGPGKPPVLIFPALGHLFERTIVNVTVYGFLPVVPMVLGSAVCMIVVSLLTAPPSAATIAKYFSPQMSETHGQGARRQADHPAVCLPGPLRRKMSLDPTALSAAQDQLDAHVREIIAWHFSPETGCPFWLDWAERPAGTHDRKSGRSPTSWRASRISRMSGCASSSRMSGCRRNSRPPLQHLRDRRHHGHAEAAHRLG